MCILFNNAVTKPTVNTLGWEVNLPANLEQGDNPRVRVMIDGVEQTTGWVAAFNPDGYITSVESSTSQVNVNNPTYGGWNIFAMTLQGTTAGEVHVFHYSPDGVQDIILSPTYDFVINGAQYLEFTAVATGTQTWDLTVGWNWVAMSVTLDDMTMASVLNDPVFQNGDVVQIQGQSAITYYDGSGWWAAGGLPVLSVGVGMKIKVSADKQIQFTGTIKESTTYSLNTGWTWISIPISDPLPLNDFLTGTWVQDGGQWDRVLLQGNLGDADYYTASGWDSVSGLTEFLPGQTVKVYKLTGGDFTFTRPTRRRFLRNVIQRRGLRHRKL